MLGRLRTLKLWYVKYDFKESERILQGIVL